MNIPTCTIRLTALLLGMAALDRPALADIAQQAYLKASNTEAYDQFGYSVAISGDTMVIGATGESSNARGVNGNQANNSANSSGAAYVFVRSGTNWVQQAYLKASNTTLGLTGPQNFGSAVAISRDIIVVGAIGESSRAAGVNGNQNDTSAPAAGAAYVFARTGTNWVQQSYLKASNPEGGSAANIYGAQFGFTVAVSGETVVVGAPYESSNATGVNGTQTDTSVSHSGAAYVFVRNGANWSQQAYLKASNPNAEDEFGTSVTVSGDTVVVGAPGEGSSATGLNGDQSDNSTRSAGAAYVFVRNGTNWSQQAYCKASNSGPDSFGNGVSVSGDTLVVGAQFEASSASGVNGDQSGNGALGAGAAYIFVRLGTNWSQQAYLKASNPDAFDYFGSSVAVSGDTVIVAATKERSIATGINGDESDNSLMQSGAAYIFVRLGTNWSQQAYLKASNNHGFQFSPPDWYGPDFGGSVAVSGGFALVGASGENSNARGVNGNQKNDLAINSGAAYLFTGLGPIIPRLDLVPFTDSITLSWSTNSIGFVLQTATTLANGGDWQDSSLTSSIVGNQNVVSVDMTSSAGFFRLRKP